MVGKSKFPLFSSLVTVTATKNRLKMKQNRMKMKLMTAVMVIAFLILMSICPTANAAIGLGISPSSITVCDALKGGTYERMITVFNTGDEIETFELTAEGECADWISFYPENNHNTPITEITIPGKDNARIIVVFNIPGDIANANYTSTIYAKSMPKKEPVEGAVAHAVIRIPSKVLIQVTGMQILKGTVKSITTADTEIGYPLKITVVFLNEGNVIAKPSIAVDITKNGEPVDSFVHDETGVKPDKKDTITVLWNTSESEPGDYLADVEVSLGDDGEVIGATVLPFKILPYGTLSRKGVLHNLSIEGKPVVNRAIKVVANFENTGEIDTRAEFKGEILLEDEIVDTLESEEMLIGVGKTCELTAYYKINEPGRYLIKGRVFYEGKETENKELPFFVPEPELRVGKGESFSGRVAGFGALSAITAIISVFLLFFKRERK